LLAGETTDLDVQVFREEARLRPILRLLAVEPEVTLPVRYLLSLFALPEDLALIMTLPPPPSRSGFEERWRYGVATSLVEPTDDSEWSFLRSAALNEFDDRWVDAGAIQSLKLNASDRSSKILEEARDRNSMRVAMIDRALTYIHSSPRPLVGANLSALAERVADALAIGSRQGNDPPRFNLARDKALIDMKFHSGSDFLVYTAAFHRVDGVWRLRGGRETSQAFAPPPPPAAKGPTK
jgi:hypothetical protein